MQSVFRASVHNVVVCTGLVGLGLLSMTAQAQIKIGLVLPLSGPLSATGNDIANGTKAYVDSINAQGGIKGRKIELLIEDDKFDPKLSESLSRSLSTDKGVSALLSCFGTVSCLAMAKVAQETGVPLLGPIAGAEVLRSAAQTKVYSVRANASEEVGRLVSYLSAIGQKTAAVAVQDDGFGKAYANSLQTASAAHGFKPSVQLSFDPAAANYAALANGLVKDNPASVILIANTLHSIKLIQALNDAAYYGQILNLAGQANGAFVKALSSGKQLAIFSTVTPSPFSSASLTAVDYRKAWLSAVGNEQYSYIGYEAYLNARVLGEALKRSANATPAALDKALSELNIDFSGLKFTFAGKRRQAASFTDLAVLSGGKITH